MKKTIIPVIIFILFFLIYKSYAVDLNSRYFYDEYAWIGRGFYFELLSKGDFKNNMWNTYGIDGDPKLSSYIYGLAIYPNYLKTKKLKNNNYDMVRYLIDHNYYERRFFNESSRLEYDQYVQSQDYIDWRPKDAEGKTLNILLKIYGPSFRKTIDLIIKARLAAVLFLSLSVVLAYLLAIRIFKSTFIAVLTSTAYGVSSLVITYGTAAYSEAFYLFFINLFLLLSMDLILEKKRKRWFKLILLGVTIALLNQTKLNGVLMLFVYGGLSVLYLLKDYKRTLIEFFVVVHVFFSVYLLTNPMLWSNPVKNTIFQYRWTHEVSEIQRKYFIFNNLPDLTSRVNYIGSYLFDSTDRGLKPFFLSSLKFESERFFIILVDLLFVLGLLGFLKDIKRKFRSTKSIFFFIALFLFIPLLFYLTLSWERYLIHLIFPVYVVVGAGLLSFKKVIS